ncbi:MAG: EI24 domain-containing protein [Bacteroidia bacterium]|nr:EI24 domain-containing protein [Bacteroidia bacterium]
MNEFFLAIKSCFQAPSYLSRYRLMWFLLIPFLLWILILSVMFWSGVELAEMLYEQIKAIAQNYALGQTLFSNTGFIVKWLVKLALWYLFWMYSRYVALALLGPALSMLSEKVEENYTKENHILLQKKSVPFFKSALRSLTISVKYAILETLLVALLSIMGLFLPFLGFVFFGLMLLVTWYFSGASVLDFVLERHVTDVKSTGEFLSEHRMFAVGIGLFYWACFSIPFISLFTGLVLGTVMSCVGTTVGYHRLSQTNNVH